MLTIHKYPLPLEDFAVVEMPRHARLLHVDVQDGSPFVWAIVDDTAPMGPRSLRVTGTGHALGEGATAYMFDLGMVVE